MKDIANTVKGGGVGVLPTDTVYGLVCNALDGEAVEKIYEIKGRPEHKPFVILISRLSQLKKLGIKLNDEQRDVLEQYWPGPNSIILDSNGPNHITRGTSTVAVRLPAKVDLLELIDKTGPIVATSANPSGIEPQQDIKWVKDNLPALDFYIEGEVSSTPSRLFKLDGHTIFEIQR